MTEEEFKKVMTRIIIFVVIALIILVVIGVLVFNKSEKSASIFKNENDLNSYKKKVEEINSSNITEEDIEKLESNPEFQDSQENNTNQ